MRRGNGWRSASPARVRAGLAALTAPLSVFLLQAVALWIWHIPSWYQAALRSDGIHAVQHLCLVLAASLFWWAMVNGRYGRMALRVGVLYVFLTAMHSSALGALLTVSPLVWYRVRTAGRRVAGRRARRPAARRAADVDSGGRDLHRVRPGAARRLARRSGAAGAVRRHGRGGAAAPARAVVALVSARRPAALRRRERRKPSPAGACAGASAAIGKYGCAACHTIPRIARRDRHGRTSARSHRGPALPGRSPDEYARQHDRSGSSIRRPSTRRMRCPSSGSPIRTRRTLRPSCTRFGRAA